jgi:hypothetical protein
MLAASPRLPGPLRPLRPLARAAAAEPSSLRQAARLEPDLGAANTTWGVGVGYR